MGRIRISIYQNRLIAHINLRNAIIGDLCIGGNEKTPLKKRGRNCYIIYLPAQHSGSISTDSSYRFSAKDRTFTTFATENLAGVKSTYLKSAVLHSGQTICLFLGALSSFTVDLCFLNLCLYRQFLLLNIKPHSGHWKRAEASGVVAYGDVEDDAVVLDAEDIDDALGESKVFADENESSLDSPLVDW